MAGFLLESLTPPGLFPGPIILMKNALIISRGRSFYNFLGDQDTTVHANSLLLSP
jgi:hypothetical protein